MTVVKPDGFFGPVAPTPKGRKAKSETKTSSFSLKSINPFAVTPQPLWVVFSDPHHTNCIDVVFVNEDGEPLTEQTKTLLQNGGLPKTARMPKSGAPKTRRAARGSTKPASASRSTPSKKSARNCGG